MQTRTLENQLRDGVDSVAQGLLFHDEPQMFSFIAQATLRPPSGVPFFGVGTSRIRKRALLKAQGEAIERRALAGFSIVNSRKTIPSRSKDFLNALAANSGRSIKGSLGDMTQGIDLISNTRIAIPTQLVTVPYHFGKNEVILREPNSSGAALGKNFSDALMRGFHELIERDAFLLSYHGKTVIAQLDCKTGNAKLRDLVAECERCRLEVKIFDISSDVGPNVALALLIDRGGLGPPLSAGLKAGQNMQYVALGALEEAVQTRFFVKNLLLDGRIPVRSSENVISSIEQRASFWLDPRLLKKLRWSRLGSNEELFVISSAKVHKYTINKFFAEYWRSSGCS